MKSAILLLLATVVWAQTPGSDQTGGITGIVRDAVTHLPLRKATITLNPTQFIGAQPSNFGPQSAVTDVTGTFSIDNLVPGKYQMMIQHQNYPQGRNGGIRKSVTISAGEKAGPIEVELIPAASISGRILDEDGDPLNGCSVQAHPADHPEQGAQGGNGSPGPGAEGEYRLYGIPPGKYVLTARCNAAAFQARPFSAGPDPPPSLAYPMQYYPLATEAKSAQVIELTPGSERSGVDFRMRPAAVTFVRGVFSPPGSSMSDLNVQMIPADSAGPRGGGAVRQMMNNPSGDYVQLQQVFPGSYFIVATEGAEDGVGAMQRVEVKDRPVETVIELKRAIDITGTIEIEGNQNGKVLPNQIQLLLIPEYWVGRVSQRQTQANDDWSFTLKSVLPAMWRVRVNVQGAFLKSASLGSTDVTESPLDLSSGTAEPLKLVLSTNTATISGTAPPGQMIWLQKDDPTVFLGRNATQVDPSGQFNFKSVAPGKYHVILADSGDAPDNGGKEVTVHEGETVSVEIKPPAQ